MFVLDFIKVFLVYFFLLHVRAAIESKRDKDRTKEENHSSSSDSGYQPYSGAGSTITTSSTEATASRCSQSSALDSSTETSAGNKPATERPTISLHATALSSSSAQPASNSPSPKTSSSSTYAWGKRTGTGLVGAAKARGWLRSYHTSSSSNADAVDSGTGSSAPPSPATVTPGPVEPFASNASAFVQSSHSTGSNSTTTTTTMTSTSGVVGSSNNNGSTSNGSSACITPAFAASLNAALASGPLMPNSTGNGSTASTHSVNPQLYDSSSSLPFAATGPGGRPSSLPPGMAPGHGLLSALVGHSSATPPTLRQTTQILFSSSSSSSTPSPTASTVTAPTAPPATTSSSYSSSSVAPSSSSTSTTISMSSAYSQVVTSIAQRNSQAQQQHQYQQQGEQHSFSLTGCTCTSC